ncbi:hypothetical protein HK097_000006 [Rhizophlyctis rosea]|uniref:DUF726-domain-containing protein n=1 Tax=Rhizophlyctis rosea TaxID=64517 RepID=A0AAD5X5G7_9FUNG|nr:hypothetical protein HK097_000006 [Rhizophlyctis rosea]
MPAEQTKLLNTPQLGDAFLQSFADAFRDMRNLLIQAIGVDNQTDHNAALLKTFDSWADDLYAVVWTTLLGRDDKVRVPIQTFITSTPHPAAPSPLTSLSPQAKGSLVRTLILLSISTSKRYDARTRSLIAHIALTSLHTPFPDSHEVVAAEELKHPDKAFSDEDTAVAAKKREEENKRSKGWKIGVAALAGGLAIGVTGGLAAPLVGAGLASVLGAVGITGSTAAIAGTIAGSSTIMSGLFGYYGYDKTSKMMEAHHKDVSEFAFMPMNVTNRLHVTICISGWLKDEEDVLAPWKGFGESGDIYALRWELQALRDLHDALFSMVKDQAYKYVKSEIISRTVLATLFAGLWPLGLLKFGRMIDNPWNNALALAEKAGKVLADVLKGGVQGGRPVSLVGFFVPFEYLHDGNLMHQLQVGYSLGALVIFHCLLSLAETSDSSSCPPNALISNVYLFGLPAPTTPETWRKIRTVVSGRLVNAYTPKDWMLAFLHRTHVWDEGMRRGVAGVMPVKDVDGVENVDVGSVVEGHVGWRVGVGLVMRAIGVEGWDDEAVGTEEVKRAGLEDGVDEVGREVRLAEGNVEVVEGDGDGMKKIVGKAVSKTDVGAADVLPPLPRGDPQPAITM